MILLTMQTMQVLTSHETFHETFIDAFSDGFDESIDEHMTRFKRRSSMKQYLQLKPNCGGSNCALDAPVVQAVYTNLIFTSVTKTY